MKQQVKHVLSKELQLYFEKIANALTNEEHEAMRETALASLRNDPGLHQLVPYFVAFIAEKVFYLLFSLTSVLKPDHTQSQKCAHFKCHAADYMGSPGKQEC